MAIISDWKKIESFDCELLEKSSADSFGLQIIDVAMWLVRRVFDYDNIPLGNCRMLFECLVERSVINTFDFKTLVRSVEIGAQYVEKSPLTEGRLNPGKVLLAELEEVRKRRMLQEPETSQRLS